ncbi:tRNA uridine-5-carboxymethylaminomethyl(34) synthesis GTPase MnmE, partial [Turicibacter sanguinis]|nr:tRNA uridine-5-carboxymethylaminomethyl(34) synthesis GTPase MnmE [Turicibacter sanguinis]
RIDLAQAEAIIDVINAKTEMAHSVAQTQLEGALSKKIKDLRHDITEMLAHITVSIDFPDEDVEHITYNTLKERSIQLQKEINKLYDTAESGKILRDGLKTVIVGKPNVGKSSLLNAVLGENRAIVTDIPGTTRDIIEEFVNIKGIPLKIVDTAGIRETEDIVEKIGVEKSREFFNSADLSIVVLDSSRNLDKEDIEILEAVQPNKTIVLLNKTDLEQVIEIDKVKEYIDEDNIINISALQYEGIEKIHEKIEDMVFAGAVRNSSDLVVTNSRHKDALYKAKQSIADAIMAIESYMPLDFIEVDFKNIWDYLGYINGDTVTEDLLDTIFSNFCIGK